MIAWMPGEPGRAIVGDDHSVHAWTGAVTHAEYAAREGIRGRSFYFITPSGEIRPGAKSFTPDTALLAKELAKIKTARWSKVEVVMDQTVQPSIFEQEQFAHDGIPSRSGMMPVIYVPSDNTVYVGREGSHHPDVVAEFSLGFIDPEDQDTIYEWTSEEVGLGGLVDRFNFGYGMIELPRKTFRSWGPWFGGNPEVGQALYDAGLLAQPDGAITYQNDEWRFAAINDEGIDTDGPPKIIELGPEDVDAPDPRDQNDDTTKYSWWNHRRPFIYDSENHEVLVGPPGTFHSQLNSAFMEYGTGGFGGLFLPGVEKATGNRFMSEVRNLAGTPRNVLEALGAHFNLPVEKQNEWKFGTVEGEWTRGSTGKAMVTKNNEVYTWNTDGIDGKPTHPMMMEQLFPDPVDQLNIRTFLTIDPQGVVYDVTDGFDKFNEEDVELVAQMIGGEAGDSGYPTEWVFGHAA